MAASETSPKGDMPALIAKVAALQNLKEYAELNWAGTFEDYLAVVRKNPSVVRSAFQRVYDMILSYGQEEYIDNKKRLIRYPERWRDFSDPELEKLLGEAQAAPRASISLPDDDLGNTRSHDSRPD